MKKLNLRDFEIICDEFHRNFTSDDLQPARIVNSLTTVYQHLFGLPSKDIIGWAAKVQCGIFVCTFKFFKNGLPSEKPEWYGVQFRCIDKSRSIRPFIKSLPEFLYHYDNPDGYFRLEQVYMEDQ